MCAKSNLGTASFLVPFLALGPNCLYCHLFSSVLIKPVPSSSHLCVAPRPQYVSSHTFFGQTCIPSFKQKTYKENCGTQPLNISNLKHGNGSVVYSANGPFPFSNSIFLRLKKQQQKSKVELLFKSTKSAHLLKRLSPKISL